MAKNEKRVQVTLACEVCKRRNYITTKNKLNDRERIEIKSSAAGTAGTPCTRRPASDRPGHGAGPSASTRCARSKPLRTLPARAVTGSWPPKGSSSTGRAPVSKTGGWGFESLLPCSIPARAVERHAKP